MHVNPDDRVGRKEIFVGGKWRCPAEGQFLDVINPASEGIIGCIGVRSPHYVTCMTRMWNFFPEAFSVVPLSRAPWSSARASTVSQHVASGAATAADVPFVMETATEAFKVLHL